MKWTADPATDRQIGYLNALLAESVRLQKALKDRGVDHADELMTQTEVVVAAAEAHVGAGTFTKGNASAAIDFIVDMNRKLGGRLRTFADGSHTVVGRETKTRVTEDGIYQAPSGDVWKVQHSREGTGRLYAKRLQIDEAAEHGPDGTVVKPARGHFVYVRGGLRSIKPSWKMTLEAAKAFGKLYGMCCVCSAELTNEQSIEEGIGPVCSGRLVDRPPVVEVPAGVSELAADSAWRAAYQDRWGRAENE
jgi:hypothetical protein